MGARRALDRLVRLGTGRGDSGQMMILFAAGMAAFLGLVGMSVDVGRIVYTKAELQKAADASVLAGAQDLPNAGPAATAAYTYVYTNVAAGSTWTTAISKQNVANDTITVTTSRALNHWFLKFVGLNSTTVTASAKAKLGFYNGGSGIVPWGLVANSSGTSAVSVNDNPCFNGFVGGVPTFKQNMSCTLKHGTGGHDKGDFGALQLDASGADAYREAISVGSTSYFKIGDYLASQTGNMVGPTKLGLNDRLALPKPVGCAGNAITDVLTTLYDGRVAIKKGCEDHPRIIVVPVIDQYSGSGSGANSLILTFAFMFVESSGTSGGNATVTGQFITIITEMPNSTYTGTLNASTAVRLTN